LKVHVEYTISPPTCMLQQYHIHTTSSHGLLRQQWLAVWPHMARHQLYVCTSCC
jgi:hypothetical protein